MVNTRQNSRKWKVSNME